MRVWRFVRANWPPILFATALAVVVGRAVWSPSRGGSTLRGAPATPFSAEVVAGAPGPWGERAELSDAGGKFVALEFWASWCGACRRSVGAVNAVSDELESDLIMLGVNIDSQASAEKVRLAHREFGFDFPTIRDPRSRLASAYEVSAIPTILLIDPSGTIRRGFVGQFFRRTLLRGIRGELRKSLQIQ